MRERDLRERDTEERDGEIDRYIIRLIERDREREGGGGGEMEREKSSRRKKTGWKRNKERQIQIEGWEGNHIA